MNRRSRAIGFTLGLAPVVLGACDGSPVTESPFPVPEDESLLDQRLWAELSARGVTGHVESTVEARLGRPVDPELAEVGRLLFFDPVLSLTGDNSCSGCHGPNASFNDSQPISIGVGNNGVVGPGRRGPHNQRRAPTVVNAAFYPRLMWDTRFTSASLDPFDNGRGFRFPPPDGDGLSFMEHLLGAQAFTPVVTRPEMAGFDVPGDYEALRAEVARRVDAVAGYRARLGGAFPEIEGGEPVRYRHVGAALAEFLFTLVRADAPVDAFARGDPEAMTARQKRGGLLFFGEAQCGECHITQDYANQMFSDFEPHVLGVPQVTPTVGNVPFDGPDANEDYGFEHATGDPADRYKFRTQPLRNVALQPSFMHNGAYGCLEDAVRHHLSAYEMARGYAPTALVPTLRAPPGPIEPVLERLQHLIRSPADLTDGELDAVLDFVGVALTDPDARPERLRHLVPGAVPSGLPVHRFQFQEPPASACAS